MKFRVERTSEKEPPCENCQWEYIGGEINSINTIEINTLEELIEFTRKYGNIIVEVENDPEMMIGPYPLIEIYDDYRE